MRLTDLNPTMIDNHVEFDCPMGHPHRICIPITRSGGYGWAATGDFPDSLTLTPSILAYNAFPNDDTLVDGGDAAAYDAASLCGWHGFITNGEMKNA
jgi:hypothetical protein